MSDAVQLSAIKLEKKMCAALGRDWSATGMSVETLVDEMVAELTRLRTVFRVNLLHHVPSATHAEIDDILNKR